MAAGGGEVIRDDLMLQPAEIGRGLPVHHEGNGLHRRAAFRLDLDPARQVVRRLGDELPPEQLAERRFRRVIGEAEQHAAALPAAIHRHHQARHIGGAAKPRDAEAERAVPAMRTAHPLLDMVDFRLPDQRAAGKEPQRAVGGAPGEHVRNDGVVFGIGEILEIGVASGIGDEPFRPRHEIRGQNQRPSRHPPCSLSQSPKARSSFVYQNHGPGKPAQAESMPAGFRRPARPRSRPSRRARVLRSARCA